MKKKIFFLILLTVCMFSFLLLHQHPTSFILYEIRLPRLLMLMMLAILLSISGYLLQQITQNELADPSLLGINQGSGVAIAILLLLTSTKALPHLSYLPLIAIIGGGLATVVLFLLSQKRRQLNMSAFILNGIGLNALLASLSLVIISRSHDDLKIDFMMKWLMGDLWSFEWPQVLILTIVTMIALILFFIYQTDYRFFALSFDEQQVVGFQNKKKTNQLLIMTVIFTSVAVAYGGGLTFIGLLSPHLAKSVFKTDQKKQLIATILFAIIILFLGEYTTQFILSAWNVSLGSVIALIGASYFLYLMSRKK